MISTFLFFLAKIGAKEQAAEDRVNKIRKNKENEKRLNKEIHMKRQKNARIKRYFEEYQNGIRKSLTAKKTQGRFVFRMRILIFSNEKKISTKNLDFFLIFQMKILIIFVIFSN